MVNRILSQSAFWMVNKAIAQEIGVHGALMLSDLIDKKIYFESEGQLDEDGFFFNTSADIEKNTTLTYHIQKQCLIEMKARGWIQTKLKGLPAKLHFKVVEDKILNFLITGNVNASELDVKEFELNNNKKNNNKGNNISASGVPPSLFSEGEIPVKNKKKVKAPASEEPASLFRNSSANNIDLVKEKLSEQLEVGIDVDFYFNSVLDWSNTKNKVFRTETGWISTIRNFMRKDNGNGKLQFVNGVNPPKISTDWEREYLNM